LMAETDQCQREYLQSIRNCAMSLSDIVNDILDFSKIESGKIELENTEFDLHALVENSVKVISGKCQEKHIDLSWYISPELPHAVVGDPVRIRQILVNLLGNAVKFTETGEIAVSVSLSNTGKSEDILPVVFSVRDTGIGISPDKSDIIFESFMQADNSTTRKYGGTGLGLAISKSLVQLMRGNIGLESEPGKGSTFGFAIPLRIARKPLPIQHIPDQKPEKISGTILVAEDNSVNMMIITQFISRTGCQVIRAENGSEAYRKFTENKVDLIFMDIHMPEMDGHEATRKIREYENGTGHTPIIAITADAMSGDKEKCLASGMDDYIAKPFKQEEVLATIRRFMTDSE
jgi:two-component system, sensor histidine kinase